MNKQLHKLRQIIQSVQSRTHWLWLASFIMSVLTFGMVVGFQVLPAMVTYQFPRESIVDLPITEKDTGAFLQLLLSHAQQKRISRLDIPDSFKNIITNYDAKTYVTDSSRIGIHASPTTKKEPDSVVDDFPALGNVISPVVRIPNWGAMVTPKQWNRTFSQIPNEEFIAVPAYNIQELTLPMEILLLDRQKNESRITSKLYYSTRHFGAYDIDSNEYTWRHAGVDLKLPEGTPFGSIAGGRVYAVRSDGILGNHVIIEHHIHGEVYYSIYGHMKDVQVVENQNVRSGEIIGTVGKSATDIPHIHLQVNKNDPEWRAVCPLIEEVANMYTVNPMEFIDQY